LSSPRLTPRDAIAPKNYRIAPQGEKHPGHRAVDNQQSVRTAVDLPQAGEAISAVGALGQVRDLLLRTSWAGAMLPELLKTAPSPSAAQAIQDNAIAAKAFSDLSSGPLSLNVLNSQFYRQAIERSSGNRWRCCAHAGPLAGPACLSA
jgi:hypothetical protein